MKILGMGNTSTTLKSILTAGDEEALKTALKENGTGGRADRSLNKKGDGALAFCLRQGHNNLVPLLLEAGCRINSRNKDNETALDILLRKVLPDDETILQEHFCPYFDAFDSNFSVPPVVFLLLKSGAHARSMQRLIMHVMKDEDAIGQLCRVTRGLDQSEQFRVAGLLLQTVVWFDQPENLQVLLKRGVDVETFWSAPFVPTIEPNVEVKPTTCPPGDSGEYRFAPRLTSDSESIQHLKLLFIQDWQAEWRDGEHPPAQYRAGLHITPWSAPTFIKAANSYSILSNIMADIMAYLPPFCGGPDLRRHRKLIGFLYLAGYSLTSNEIRHLQLVFQMDMSAYVSYSKQPRPLMQLSRTAIRFSLSSNVVHAVEKLQMLPASIRRYLLLEESHDLIV